MGTRHRNRYVGFVTADGELFGFVIRDTIRECPAIYGYGMDSGAAIRATIDLLKTLNG